MKYLNLFNYQDIFINFYLTHIQNNLLPNIPMPSIASTYPQYYQNEALRIKKVTDNSSKSMSFIVPSAHQCEEYSFSLSITSHSM